MQSCQAGGMKFCVHCKVKATVQLEVAEAGTMDRSVRLNQSLCHTSPARGKKVGNAFQLGWHRVLHWLLIAQQRGIRVTHLVSRIANSEEIDQK